MVIWERERERGFAWIYLKLWGVTIVHRSLTGSRYEFGAVLPVRPRTATEEFHQALAACPGVALSHVLTRPSSTLHLSGAVPSELASLPDLQPYSAPQPALDHFISARLVASPIFPSPHLPHSISNWLSLGEISTQSLFHPSFPLKAEWSYSKRLSLLQKLRGLVGFKNWGRLWVAIALQFFSSTWIEHRKAIVLSYSTRAKETLALFQLLIFLHESPHSHTAIFPSNFAFCSLTKRSAEAILRYGYPVQATVLLKMQFNW